MSQSTNPDGSKKEESFPITVHLTPRDMKKSVAYYRDVLGFTVSEIWPSADDPMWANCTMGRQSVMLGALCSEADAAKFGLQPDEIADLKKRHAELKQGVRGLGVDLYIRVEDVDKHYETVKAKDARCLWSPKTRFYGLRDFGVTDHDGYRILFYTPTPPKHCESCGGPVACESQSKYCNHCVDASGKLLAYDKVLQGTIEGYFIGMQKMPRPQAEKAAREHLAKMPAWQKR